MCGICGLIEESGKTPDYKLIENMRDTLAHRGPDDAGVFIKNNVAFAHRRLSILDLTAAGHQPFLNEKKTIVLTFNGEIYNYKEINQNLAKHNIYCKSNCDTESLLRLYELHGIACLKYLRGMFAFAIFDFEKNLLFAARDRLGKKPFFYAYQDGRFYFASEIKAILTDPRFKKKPNYEALHYYLSFKYTPHPYSAFVDIHKLPHGHYLIYQNNKITIENYWQNWFKIDNSEKITDENTAKKTIREKLLEAVKLRMISDVPLGAFLSGGIDSSIIVGLMTELSAQPIKTFSIGFKEKRFDETEYSNIIANRFKTDHHNFYVDARLIEDIDKLVWHYNEPFADSSMLPTYYLSRETRKYVTVALSGDAGDENFAGYLRYLAYKLTDYAKILPNMLRKQFFGILFKLLPPTTKQQTKYNKFYRLIEILSKDGADRYLPLIEDFSDVLKEKLYTADFKKRMSTQNSKQLIERYFNFLNTDDDLDKLLFTDLNTYLVDDIMTKVDIASMAVSLECRAPLMDHLFVEYVSSIHSSLKLKGKTTKYILKETFKDYFPAALLNREKMGFTTPVSDWFRTDLRKFIIDIFDDRFFERGMFEREQILNLLNEHLSAKAEHGYRLWSLMCLELWFRKFFD